MIVILNGWPGVGKLTVGLELAAKLQGRLLDNHSVVNVATVLTDYGTDDYYRAIRDVRDVAFRAILRLPRTVPIIMTGVLATGGPTAFAEEYRASITNLVKERGSPLYDVTLTCQPSAHFERVQSPSRWALHKYTDPKLIRGAMSSRQLIEGEADYSRSIDNTDLDPAECAQAIVDWIRGT